MLKFKRKFRRLKVNIRDDYNDTSVHCYVVAYSVDIFVLLLGKRTSVKMTKIDDKNPHHISAEFGNLEARKGFIERGTTLNKANNKYGVTPLILAA